MSKRYFGVLFIISMLCGASLAAQVAPGELVQRLLVDLTTDFKQQNPNLAFRPTVAVLTIEEASEDAKKHRIADALYPLIESLLNRSTIFELVERKNLEALIKEQELSLTGLTADGKVSLGGLKEAEYILRGSLTELGQDLQLSFALVSVQTGSVIASQAGTIPKSVLIASADEFAAKYVSPYGIGIELQVIPVTYFPLVSQGETSAASLGLGLNYRLSKNFVFDFGFDVLFLSRAKFNPLTVQTGDQQQPLDKMESISDYPTIANPSQATVDYGDSRTVTSAFLGLFGVINLSREFNISAGANLRLAYMAQVQRYDLNGAKDLGGLAVQPNTIHISSSNFAFYGEPAIKFQWYLNPRFTLNLGYSLNLRLADLTAHTDYVYAGRNYRQEKNKKIELDEFDITPWIDPYSGEVLKNDFSAHRIFVAVGFYF